MRKPKLLGFDPDAVAGVMDYYEATMADTNIVAGIDGRRSIFNAAVRVLRKHKVVHEDDFTSDGRTAVIGGEKVALADYNPNLDGQSFHVDQVEHDNYLLNMGLEQILAFLSKWQVSDNLIKFYADRGLSHETVNYFRNNRKLDLTIDAIPEGIPIFEHEPFISVDGSFEQVQFPESLILGTWGYQTAVATSASYVKNILREFDREDIITLEGGSRRLYPACALAATRAALAAGFSGTSLVEISQQYPELIYKIGGSSGHSAILHIGSDEEAFELQLRSYYGIRDDDSDAVIREKILQVSKKGIGPTFLIDTFGSEQGLAAAIKAMKKYGIQSQVRQDSDIRSGKVKGIRASLNESGLPKSRIMVSDDLKPWVVYELLRDGVDFNSLLMGTYLVNPYKLPGPVFKIAADQTNIRSPDLQYRCKLCTDNPAKGTWPGPLDVYRIIGKDGKADRDVILLRGVDSIDTFVGAEDQGYIKLNRTVMDHGELAYEIPDMCQVIENTAYHLGLLRPEYKRFRNASSYPVVISPTLERVRGDFRRRFETGKI